MPTRFSTRDLGRACTGAFFVVAGIGHLVAPEAYLPLMPSYLPKPDLLIAVSGVAEIAGGIGLWHRATRRFAVWGLIALLVAVFPANLHATLHGLEWRGQPVPSWLLWARLPLQPLLMLWVASLGREP